MAKRCAKTPDEIKDMICSGDITTLKALECVLEANDQISPARKNVIYQEYFKQLIESCEPALVLEVENTNLSGCWQDASTGEKVSITYHEDEQANFLSYKIHMGGGDPIDVSSLAGYEPCKCPPLNNSGLVTDITAFN